MVPKDWKTLSLGEITKEKISYGIVQAGPHVENGVPYIKSSNVGGEIKIEDLQRTSSEIHHKYRRSAVHPNDIVFSLRGNIGRTSIVPPEMLEANLTQGTARISVNTKNETNFVYYSLASTPILNRINSLSKGSTFKEISLEELRKVKLPIPPLPEQQKIAKILSTWDKAISTTERLIENSTQQKKALMQQLLTGKKRLLDEFGERFEGEWEEAKISKWLIEYKEKSTTQDQYDVYTSSRNGLVLQSDYFANSRIAGRDNIGFHVIPPNHITYRSRSDDGFFTFNLFSSDKNGLISNYYPVFSTKGINEFFIALFEHYRAVFGRYSVGTSQKVLSLNALKG